MLRLGEGAPWTPPVLLTTATDDDGVAALCTAIAAHRAHLEASGELAARRQARVRHEVEALAAERFRRRAVDALVADGDLARRLRDRSTDPYAAAEELLHRTETDG
jgi:LAO/AO transport system kinase